MEDDVCVGKADVSQESSVVGEQTACVSTEDRLQQQIVQQQQQIAALAQLVQALQVCAIAGFIVLLLFDGCCLSRVLL